MRTQAQAWREYKNDSYVATLQATMSSAEYRIYSLLLGEEVPFTMAGVTFDFGKQELIFTATKDPQVIAEWRNRLGEYLAAYTRSMYPEFIK